MADRCLVERLFWVGIVVLVGGCSGCLTNSSGQNTVVVYSALDREFAESVLDDFTKATGIRVLAKYDDESTKTVGLTSALIQEAGRPRCDVFWNNEILNTLRLEQRGMLEAYRSPAGEAFPAAYRSREGFWNGFAARARVLIVNTKLVDEKMRPKSIFDLADERWKGKIGIARPVAGTTATQVACLFVVLGEDQAKTFLRNLKKNEIQILGGNKQVAQACAAGQIIFGLTDTDDAVIEIERAAPVAIVYPDREPDDIGTLFIPNTLALVKGGPHGDQARRLMDYLLSPVVEEKLARGPSAQIPLNPAVMAPGRIETQKTVKPMAVDFAVAAKAWETASRFIEAEFLAK